MFRVAILGFLAIAVASPGVAAQAAPQIGLAMDIPAGPADIELGGSHDVPFEVTLTLRGVVCTSASQVRVPIMVTDKPSPLAGVRATPEPAEFVFDVPAGQYSSAAFSKTASGTLAIMVSSDAMASHEHTFEVIASYPGGTPSGCQGTGAAPAAEGKGEHAILTGSARDSGPASPSMHVMEDGSKMEGNMESAEANKTPGPGLALALGAIVLAFVVRRR